MERGGGDFAVVLKYLPYFPVPEFRLLEGDTSDLFFFTFCLATSLPSSERRATYLIKKGEKGKVKT